MNFKLLFTIQANKDLEELENDKGLEKRLKTVSKVTSIFAIKS
ncbi:hypothetical protein [Rickettsia endosymbiont of Pantilius tunicatus]